MENVCRFFKQGICAYKHISTINAKKMEDLEKEVKRLRNQIVDLTEENKEKLKLIEKESTENQK